MSTDVIVAPSTALVPAAPAAPSPASQETGESQSRNQANANAIIAAWRAKTPEQRAAWGQAKFEKELALAMAGTPMRDVTAKPAPPAAPAVVPAVADDGMVPITAEALHGYTVPSHLTHMSPGASDQFKAARAAGITQDQVYKFLSVAYPCA